MPPQLLVDISSHGFGHLAQTGPVLNELGRLLPQLRITVRTTLPRQVLAHHIQTPFAHVSETFDFGMVMHSAVDVDPEASAARYLEFHRDWEARVEREAQRVAELAPDLLFANVPYLSLAAAARAGAPAVAMSSLNWAAIFAGVLGHRPGVARIHDAMLAAYRSARAFLRPTPAMPMTDLPNRKSVAPIARLGTRRRGQLQAEHGIGRDEKLVLAALGGIPTRLPIENWPRLPGVRWIVPADWKSDRRDTLTIEAAGLSFGDLLASCDAVIAKPGYGTFVEAACNGAPVLYLRRPGWPEEACLVDWLKEYAVCAEVGRAELEGGRFGDELLSLFALPRRVPPAATGAREAAEILAGLLRNLT